LSVLPPPTSTLFPYTTLFRSLFLFDPDGDNGYPGNMKLYATYKLDNENNLSYKLEAVSDQLTIFNPANHTYFNLGERATDLKLRSEEHTSELQSRFDLVCRLL